jgi:hypothetical protein
MKTHLKAFLAIAAMAMLAGYARSSAQCPSRPPGYWLGTQCWGGVTITYNGAPCLVELCFCEHKGNGTLADPDEYYIYSLRGQIPGCPGPTPDPVTMESAMRKLVNLHTQAEDDQIHPCGGETRYVTASHAMCAQNIGQGSNIIWQGCPSGECKITYLVCDQTGITLEVSRTATGTCDPGQPCTIIC